MRAWAVSMVSPVQSTQTVTMTTSSNITRGSLSKDFIMGKFIHNLLVCSVMLEHNQFCTKTVNSLQFIRSLCWFIFSLLRTGQIAWDGQMHLELEAGFFRDFSCIDRMGMTSDQCSKAALLSWAERCAKATWQRTGEQFSGKNNDSVMHCSTTCFQVNA